jgi:hypothetical protein
MWQLSVMVERGFIFPTRMDVEETWIAGCAESVNGKASRFLAGRAEYFLDTRRHGVLQSFFGVEAGEDEEL